MTTTIQSSTLAVPPPKAIPSHVAIIMDGNGRWANQRFLPRVAGHSKGVDTVKTIVQECASYGIKYLTLFAFSTENWRRPSHEVTFLMRLFFKVLKRQVSLIHKNNLKLVIVGDLSAFPEPIRKNAAQAQQLTENNTGLVLTIAANYGGRWDILNAMRLAYENNPDILPENMTEEWLSPYLSMSYAPEPDLFIRTGGEQRVSNFLIWQLAYTEMYYTPIFWPDFDQQAFADALTWYRFRERRFGQTGHQLLESQIVKNA
jgi:undecaprenyl diphosphate synthase